MIRRSAAALLIGLVALAAGACGPNAATGSAPVEVMAPRGPILGCLSIERVECEFVAAKLLAQLPGERGAPFGIAIHLYGCANMDPCPRSLAFREGSVTVEWADPEEPLQLSVKGTPNAPVFGEIPMAWSGLQVPSSARVDGRGPFPFDLGHCGLTWQLDFDGSFWVPFGQIDGDASPIINSDSGQIRLLGPDVAEYRNGDGFVATLGRFPGPKHVFLCA